MRHNVLYIGNQLSKHGLSVSMMESIYPLLGTHYKIYSASSYKNPILRLADMIFTLIRRRNQVKVVLIETFSTSAFYFALIIAFISRGVSRPYIPILRGGNLPERIKYNTYLSRSIFQNSYINIAPSEYLYHAFSSSGYQTILIPNYIHINLYPYKTRQHITPRLLWVRSFHNTYNPEMAIRVVASLAPSYPAIQLCMVGPDKDGSLERCRQLAEELGVADRITFTGLLPKSEWIALSADYDIFINTTNFDNTPVSVIEAMALGLPVVSTDVGGMPFLIDDGVDGRLVPQGDTEAFAAAITQLLEHPGNAFQLSQNARKKVELYDWEVVKNQWFEVIDGAISHSKEERTT